MKNDERNFKEEVKELWSKNKDKIVVGAKCLGIGLTIGFIRGLITAYRMSAVRDAELIKKIPYEPDYDDIAEYVHDHVDELKPFIETEIEYIEEANSTKKNEG